MSSNLTEAALVVSHVGGTTEATASRHTGPGVWEAKSHRCSGRRWSAPEVSLWFSSQGEVCGVSGRGSVLSRCIGSESAETRYLEFPHPPEARLALSSRLEWKTMWLKAVQRGLVEVLLGLLLVGLSMNATVVGRLPLAPLLVDLAAFACVLVATRWLRAGSLLLMGVLAAGLLVDQEQLGIAGILCMLPVVTAVRRSSIAVALVSSVVFAGVNILGTHARFPDAGWGDVTLTWLLAFSAPWIIGYGLHLMERYVRGEADREHAEQRRLVLTELHDSAARELSILVRDCEALADTTGASSSQLQGLAARAQMANASLREAMKLLSTGASDAKQQSAATALTRGVRELERRGVHVKVNGALPDQLTGSVDLALGAMLSEALHNVAKHADLKKPCVVTITTEVNRCDVLVTNSCRTSAPTSPTGFGLIALGHRARSVGGEALSERVGDRWLCQASVPSSASPATSAKQ